MRAVCGVDGCRGGWVAIVRDLDSGAVTCRLFRSFAELVQWRPPPEVVAVDIPIGLPDAGPRECDREARRLLGRPRASSVFPAPIRAVLDAHSHAEASRRRQRVEGRRLSIQTWLIVPKIREVDAVLRQEPSLRARVREAHPEVSFFFLRGGAPMAHGKRSAAGREERRRALVRVFGAAVPRALARRRQLGSAADDVLDAFAVLWTAERVVCGTARRLPATPPRDRCGLAMEIVA